MLQTINGKTMLEDNIYSVGKKAVQIWIPAVSALYFGLGTIWGFPAIEKVTGSCAVIAVFVGAVLRISSNNFDRSGAGDTDQVGKLIVVPKEDGAFTYRLDLDPAVDPVDIQDKKTISFKVVPQDGQENPPKTP